MRINPLSAMAVALSLAAASTAMGEIYYLELVGPIDVEVDDPFGAQIGDELTVRYTFDDSVITEQVFVDWLPGEPYLAGNAYQMVDVDIWLNGQLIIDELSSNDASLLLYNEYPGADGFETGPGAVLVEGGTIAVSSNMGTTAEWLVSLDPAENIGITNWEELTPGGGYHYGTAVQTGSWIIRFFPKTYEIGPNPADLNGDGLVNVTDLVAIITNWGPCGDPCLADINGDGQVNVTDLIAVITAWS